MVLQSSLNVPSGIIVQTEPLLALWELSGLEAQPGRGSREELV